MSNATEVTAWTAEAVRAAIERAGMTKKSVSDMTGIPYPTLNRKTAGHSEFSFTDLLAIADVLKVSPAEFVPPPFQEHSPRGLAVSA